MFNGEQQPTPTENTYGAPNSNNLYGNYGAPNRSNPYGNYGSPNGNNPYGGNPYGGSDYNTFNNNTRNGGAQENPYTNFKAPVTQQRGMNMGLMIFSIINTLIGCCTCSGLIFGIAAMVFTVLAKNQPTDEDAAKYNKISMILNIVGIISTILVTVTVVVYSIMIGIEEGYSTY